tara:strand:- start:3780 stop:4205 length:426 start_codon:yes stop_codon:yes gene_type:complete
LAFHNLKKRIKKNEGFCLRPYKDQLGYLTIGYGHLIRQHEKKYFHQNFKKKHFENLFEIDFYKSVQKYNRIFKKKHHTKKDKELLIEMIYQLGSHGVLKFKKMLFYLNKKQKYMTCLEMMDSLWYKQTPNRVSDLIKNFIR